MFQIRNFDRSNKAEFKMSLPLSFKDMGRELVNFDQEKVLNGIFVIVNRTWHFIHEGNLKITFLNIFKVQSYSVSRET